MKLSDLSGVFHKNTYPLRRSYAGADGCTVFELENTHGTTWLPGQHGIFTLPETTFSGQKWRAFSIASIPSEGTILLATKISDTPSNFKAVLRDLEPGAPVAMRGPIGWFYFQDDTSPVVMVAGGVGITPIRALFKQMEAEGNQRDVTLIYSARDSYLFKDELDAIAATDPKITITYTHSVEETTDAIREALDAAPQDAYYFISGAPKMITSIRKQMTDHGVVKKRIITDPFKGY